MIPFAKLERYEGNESLFELVLMSVVSTLVEFNGYFAVACDL
jgi:hypothetical protein